MTLSKNIKHAREHALLSQKVFAEKLDVSVGTVNRWENGKSRPTITAMNNLRSLCEEYHIDFEPIEREWFEKKEGIDYEK